VSPHRGSRPREQVSLPQWSDEAVAENFRAEIRTRFEEHNAASRARDAAELEVVLREHPDKRGQPGYEVRDSGAWCVYQASEIRIEGNSVTVVLPRGYAVGLDLVYLFDHTAMAWSRPSIGATIVDGEARPTIEILLVATWDSGLDALWRRDEQGRRQVLVELFEDDARALVAASDQPHHVACNCRDYLSADQPCLFCAGMPVRAEVLLKIRDPLRSALEGPP
jgi:hypothetical protein